MTPDNHTRRRAALFDLDGVLIDTEGDYTRLWGEIGRRYVPDIPDFAAIIKGNTLTRILDTYFPDETTRNDLMDWLDHFEAEMTFDPFPSVMELLDDLHAHGMPAAIVTSSGTDKMIRLSQRRPELLEAFDTIVTAADISRSKPDPEGYLLGASRLGAKPCDCFVFEDSLSGLEAGRAAGARVIAVATTLPATALQGHGHLIVDTVADITADTLLSLFP